MSLIRKENIKMDILFHDIWQVRESNLILGTPQQMSNGVVKELFVPLMILKSLECELEMKYILLQSTGCTEKTHSLSYLFNSLHDDIKNSCITICTSSAEFYKYLEEYSNSFIDYRYENDFQGIGSLEPWFLKKLSDILYEYLIALQS